MCTSILLKGIKNLFGRNLDVFDSFNENIVFIPRQHKIHFKKSETLNPSIVDSTTKLPSLLQIIKCN